MEATTDRNGTHRVRMKDDEKGLYVYTPEGEVIHIWRGYKGVSVTLWGNGEKYTKTTQNKTIITLQPTQNK